MGENDTQAAVLVSAAPMYLCDVVLVTCVAACLECMALQMSVVCSSRLLLSPLCSHVGGCIYSVDQCMSAVEWTQVCAEGVDWLSVNPSR